MLPGPLVPLGLADVLVAQTQGPQGLVGEDLERMNVDTDTLLTHGDKRTLNS